MYSLNRSNKFMENLFDTITTDKDVYFLYILWQKEKVVVFLSLYVMK